jgi:hypothetical protein
MMRCVREYASYKVKRINENKEVPFEVLNNKVNGISHMIRLYERGIVTIDETMRYIAEVEV